MPSNAKCIVPFCKHPEKDKKCRLSSFPRDEDRCKKWVQVVGQRDFLHLTVRFLSRNRYVCGCHFKADDYVSSQRRKLKNSAIPTIFDSRITTISDDEIILFPPKNPITISCIQKRVPFILPEKADQGSAAIRTSLVDVTNSVENLPPTFIDTMSIDTDDPVDTGTMEENACDEDSLVTMVYAADSHDDDSNKVLSKKKKFRPPELSTGLNKSKKIIIFYPCITMRSHQNDTQHILLRVYQKQT